jgi:hypothetical protein
MRQAAVSVGLLCRQSRLTWPAVLRCLGGPKTRERACSLFAAAGFTPDHFMAKRAAREAMAGVLSRVEDWLELERPGARQDRSEIRAVRRRLELELWP